MDAPVSEPCVRCGVRGDIGCKHRAAEGVAPIAITGSGRADRRKGNLNSPFGKHGNPAGPARDRILASLKAAMRGG
jgi:hypothetical protein